MFRNVIILINDVVVTFLVRFVSFSAFHIYYATFLRFVIKKCRSVHLNIVLTYFFDLHASGQNLLLSLQLIIDLSTFSRYSCEHLFFVFCFQSVSLHLKCNFKVIFNFDASFRHSHFMHANSE